jgi:hypothetical protein
MVNGELVVRLRLDGASTTRRPRFISESRKDAQVVNLRAALPAHLKKNAEPFTRARSLASYLAARLTYVNRLDGATRYSPWNYWEILRANEENKRTVRGGDRPGNIVFCVHFTIAFVQAATALGLRARCAVTTDGIHKTGGHFFPEVWLPQHRKWAIADPTGDFCFVDETGVPKSALELYDNRDKVRQWLRFGPSARYHTGRLKDFLHESVAPAATYRNVGYWRRSDFFSHPGLAAAEHGNIPYCEPDIVWIKGDDPALEAFPYDCRAVGS